MQSITIYSALSEIEAGNYLLPAFQREFVWKHTQVEMLFDSLMRGYPIGAMMFWKLPEKADDKYKFYRFIKSFIETHKTRNEVHCSDLRRGNYAVLDGQQRLTALYIGLCGTYAYKKLYAWSKLTEGNYPTRRLYLDISRTYEDDEEDRMYHFNFLANHEEDFFEDSGKKWFRVGKILSLDSIVTIRDFSRKYALEELGEATLYKLFQMIWTDKPINYFEEQTHDPDVAVNIFSRINSGGTPLSYADILLSITIANWRRLDARNEIYGLVESVNNNGFNITHDYILKAFLFLHHDDVQFRIKSFDNGFIGGIEDRWENIKNAIQGLFALMKSYGLNSSSLTSNYATLPILKYIYDRNIYENFATSVGHKEDRAIIKKWLFKTLLLRTFGYRSDGMLRKARNVLRDRSHMLFPTQEMEQALLQRVNDDNFIEGLLSYQKENRYTYVLLSMIYQNLVFEGMRYHVDHMHPYLLCQQKGLNKKVFNSILNLQLLPESENTSKGAMELEKWVEGLTTDENKNAFMKSRLIPDTDLSLDNFNVFIEKRAELLTNSLQKILL